MDNNDEACSSDEPPFDNLQTWPKTQLSHRGLSELHEWIHLENVISQAKSFIHQSDDSKENSSAQKIHIAAQLINALTKELENARDRTKTDSASNNRVGHFQKRRKSVTPMSSVATVNESNAPPRRTRFNSNASCMNVIREDPHFESMIICDTSKKPMSKSYGSLDTVRSISEPQFFKKDQIDEENILDGLNDFSPPPEIIQTVQMPGECAKDPAFIRAIPHFLLLAVSVLYLIGGAYIFTLADPQIAAKPFHTVLLFAFQTCTSIGWGDTSPTNRWSQMFCVIYTIFGVPIIFSAFANVGRLMTEFYCIDWLFLTAVVRERVKTYAEKIFPSLPNVEDNFQTVEVRRRFPVKATINLLFIHQCIGILLYGSLIKQFTVIQTIYFSITSMATTGYGDIHPDPETMGEAIAVIIYISSGIIILSALLLSIGYYFQRIIYVIVPNYLHYYYEKYRRKSTVANEAAENVKKLEDLA